MSDTTHVYLITGFLGSGKTTFLNRIIQSFPAHRKLMILMNEFGEVGVDGTLLEGEDLDILEISKGSIFCVCVKTDFIRGLHEIAQKHRPDVLLMESTGVANPTDLKRDLKLPFFQDRFRFAEQFCVVDAANFEEAYHVFSSVEKQIESSTVFIVNKTDLASAEQVHNVKELIALHHPDPKFYETTYCAIPWEAFFSDETEGVRSGSGKETDEERAPLLSSEEVESAIERLLDDPAREVTPPDRLVSSVYAWEGGAPGKFRELAQRLPKGVVRAKGFLSQDGQAYLFSWVMGRWTLETASLPPDRLHLSNRIVFIGPPEVMPHLEALGRESTSLRKESTLDPMAGRQQT